jgi:hypothetical protein
MSGFCCDAAQILVGFSPNFPAPPAKSASPLLSRNRVLLAMVRKLRWSFKDVVVRRLMDDIARSSRSWGDVVKETVRSPEAKKKTGARSRSLNKAEAKKN